MGAAHVALSNPGWHQLVEMPLIGGGSQSDQIIERACLVDLFLE